MSCSLSAQPGLLNANSLRNSPPNATVLPYMLEKLVSL